MRGQLKYSCISQLTEISLTQIMTGSWTSKKVFCVT